ISVPGSFWEQFLLPSHLNQTHRPRIVADHAQNASKLVQLTPLPPHTSWMLAVACPILRSRTKELSPSSSGTRLPTGFTDVTAAWRPVLGTGLLRLAPKPASECQHLCDSSDSAISLR